MSAPCWRLQRFEARLELERLTARLDLSQPADGLRDIRLAATTPTTLRAAPEQCPAPAGMHVLGIDIPSRQPLDRQAIVESYVRGADLVTAYGESEAWPVRVDATWRAMPPSDACRTLASIDLVVSVRTELLDTRPELAVQGAIPTGEVLRLVDADSFRLQRLPLESSLPLGPGEGPGCLLFRPSGVDSSYVEMVHPTDFQRDELRAAGNRRRHVQIRHRLFPQPLEKGVIFRARVRGVFCRRSDDTRVAAAVYAAFAEAEPPLSS